MSEPDRLRVHMVDRVQELDALRPAWNEAALAASPPNVYLTWEWASTWWKHFGREGGLHVLVFRDSEGLAAIAPLQITPKGVGVLRSRVLERINPEAGDCGGLIVIRRCDDVADTLIDHVHGLVRRRRISAFILSRLASDDPFLAAWRRAAQRRSGMLETSESRLEGGCCFTDVRLDFKLSKYTKKHKVRQRLRRLEEAYDEVDFVRHSGADLDTGLGQLLQLHERRRTDDRVRGLLADREREALMLDAVRALDSNGWVRLLTLVVDGRPVAAELDLELGDRVFMFKSAFDPEFAPYSPGQLLHHKVFEEGMARGMSVFDFGRGDQSYKQRWANGGRHLVTTVSVRTGMAGRLAFMRLRFNRALAVRWPSVRGRIPLGR